MKFVETIANEVGIAIALDLECKSKDECLVLLKAKSLSVNLSDPLSFSLFDHDEDNYSPSYRILISEG